MMVDLPVDHGPIISTTGLALISAAKTNNTRHGTFHQVFTQHTDHF